MLDFGEPIALVLSAILHFVPDEEKPAEILRTFVEALPPGSYVLATHVTPEHEPRLRPASAGYRDDGVRTQPRTAAEFERLVFTGQGLRLVEPGVVLVSQWRRDPDEPDAPSPAEVSAYGGLAAKADPRGARAPRVTRVRSPRRRRPAGPPSPAGRR